MNTLLPIVTRELRVRARQPRTFYSRVGAAALLIVIVGGLLLFVSGFSGAGMAGHGLFQTLIAAAYLFCLSDGLRSTADCLSEEKRAGTLGLLFLTDLRGYDVVLGKLLANSLNSFYILLAILPPLAIPILLGGVTGGEFWRSALALVSTLLFSLSTGLMVSAAVRDERKAWSWTIVILLALAMVPPLIEFATTTITGKSSQIGVFSPTTMMLALWDTAYSANPGRFWGAFGVVSIVSFVLIGIASWLLPRSWQEEPVLGAKSESPREATVAIPTALATPKERRDRHLLAANPMFWLANRSTGDASFLWLIAGVGLLITVAGVCFAHSSTAGTILVALSLLGLHYLMVARIAWEACHQFGGARDSGALEILLCTPLTPTAIINGHLNALRRLFLLPSLVMLALALTLFAVHSGTTVAARQSGAPSALLTLAALVVWGIAFMDLHAAAHYGLWMGLKSRKHSQALSRTLLYIVGLPMLSAVCCWVIWPIVALVKNLVAMNYARDQLQRNFRDVVAGRYEPIDESPGSAFRRLLPIKDRPSATLPSVLPRKPD